MSDILNHIDAGVMTLTFNRLDKKNSITSDMYAALADGIEQAKSDASVRVVVIQGHESIFSAGNDIGDFLNKPPSTQDSPVFRFLRGIATFEKPLIAAVAGPAVGIGTTLLFHCDLFMPVTMRRFPCPSSTWACALKRRPACWCRACSATTALQRRCCWANLSLPKPPKKWAWSTVCCRPWR